MIERKKADIDILLPNGEPILSVLIAEDNKRVYRLMGDDYIELHFANDCAIHIPVGSYVDDELFGRFYVTEEQMPEFVSSSGAYNYELKLEAWYKIWSKKQMMLVSNSVRKENEWYLTASLREQARQLMLNLQSLGYIPSNVNLNDDTELSKYVDIRGTDIPKKDMALTVSYDKIKITEALEAYADTWDCEWWVTGTEASFIVHLGKCEDGEEIPISVENFTDDSGKEIGLNAVSIQPDKDSNEFCNKIYAYGSTNNIPVGYRKSIKAVVKSKVTAQQTNEQGVTTYTTCYELNHEFENSMFILRNWEGKATAIYNKSVTMPYGGTPTSSKINEEFLCYWEDIEKGADPSLFNQTMEIPYSNVKAAGSGHINIHFTKGTALVNVDTATFKLGFTMVLERQGLDADGTPKWYEENTLASKEQSYTYKDYCAEGSDVATLTGHDIGFDYNVSESEWGNNAGTFRIKCKISILPGTDVYIFQENAWQCDADVYGKLSLQKEGDTEAGIPFSWTKNGVTLSGLLKFNPLEQPKYVADGVPQYHYHFYNPALPNGGWSNLAVGDEITLDSSSAVFVPSAFYTSDYDSPFALCRIGDNRLCLPKGRRVIGNWVLTDEGFVIPTNMEDTPNAKNVQEKVVIFESIYPEGKLQVSDVITEEATFTEEYEDEREDKVWQYHIYHLHLRFLSGIEFNFSEDFRLENTKLKLDFLIPEDTKGISGPTSPMTSADYPDNFKLAGMTFETEYKKKALFYRYMNGRGQDWNKQYESAQDFRIISNEDFGTKLPGEVLKPKVNDPCVLIGWNPRAIAGLGLVEDAETRLLNAIVDYLEALQEGNFTFTANMTCGFLFDLYGEYVRLASNEPKLLKENQGKYIAVRNGYTAYLLPQLGQKVCVKYAALSKDKHTRVIGIELKMDKPYDNPVLICGETEAYSRIKKIEKTLNILTT